LGQHEVYPYQGQYRLQYLGFIDGPERLAALNAFDLVFDPQGKLTGIAPVDLARLKGAERRKRVADKIQSELNSINNEIPELEFALEAAKASPAAKRKAAVAKARRALERAQKMQARLEQVGVDLEASRVIEFHLWSVASLVASAEKSKRKANPFDIDGIERALTPDQHDALVSIANMDLHLDRSPSGTRDSPASMQEIGSRLFSNSGMKSLPKGLSMAQAALIFDLSERYRKQFGCKDFKPTPRPLAHAFPMRKSAYTAGANVLDFTQ
jgi:hypothetical protein